MLAHDEFVFVVLDTGLAFAAVALLHLWKLKRWILAGVAVSLAAALVQASGDGSALPRRAAARGC
jgi:hypothetical protein